MMYHLTPRFAEEEVEGRDSEEVPRIYIYLRLQSRYDL
jgi:hypothetical protein